ncbi:MAG: alpha-1,3-fucosyltransferase [Chloroflexi bacterium]|nr:alpha-1,3-fucosyltransferase [Chloroflexota bacterium]
MRQLWHAVRRRLGIPAPAPAPAPARAPRLARERLILFFNPLWGETVQTTTNLLPGGFQLTNNPARLADADAVVFHIPTLNALPALRPPGQLWVASSMECEVNYPRLRDPDFMRHFDLTMTYRLNADVTTTYVSYYSDASNLARALRTPPRPRPSENLAALFISSTIDQSGRLGYAAELMSYLDVHSYGRMLHTHALIQDRGRPTKLELIASYRFTLAFENAVAEDYVTEKFFDPLVVGSVPVYLGAPNIAAFAPGDRCFVNVADFAGPKELAEYLLHLRRDEAAYADYFVWKERPFRPEFLTLLAGQEAPAHVRLARAVQQRLAERAELHGQDQPV